MQPLKILIVVLCALTFGTVISARADPGSKSVRLAIVITPKFSGLIDALIADFKAGGVPDAQNRQLWWPEGRHNHSEGSEE